MTVELALSSCVPALRNRSVERSSDSADHFPELDAAWLRTFRRRVVNWFEKHARLLPFRETRDPYRVWVSEVMLQQTTVAAVVPFYERFLERFPTVESLAAATEHDVLRSWEGLGYYSRARNLHAAAKRIVTDQCGRFPRSAAELERLPGLESMSTRVTSVMIFCNALGFRGDSRGNCKCL